MVGRVGDWRIGRVGHRAAALAVATMLLAGPFSTAPAVATAASSNGPVSIAQAGASLSAPLRDLTPDPLAQRAHGMPLDMLTDRPTHSNAGPAAHVKDGALQTAPTTSALSTGQSFDGLGNIDGVYPPDTNGAVGPNHYVQWVNLHVAIYSKTGTLLSGPFAGNTLWSGTGTACATQNAGDPIVLYDRRADRWLFGQFTSSPPYGECIAVSQSGDPTGSYYRYFLNLSNTVFYDYPKLGIWSDGYYLTMNRFTQFFQGASAFAIDRNAMLAGQTVRYLQFTTSTSYGTLLPADIDGSTMPPAGAPEPIAEIGSSALHLWQLKVDWTNTANSTFTGPTSLPVAAYNQLCPNTRSCVPQPGTNVGLDGLGDRLMYRLAYRNLGDHEALVVDHAVNVAGSGVQAGMRWYEIRGVSTTPTLYQQGTFAPDTTSRWIGTMAIDASGGIGLGYSVSSSSVYPGLRITGRLAGDPLGVMTQGEATVVAGSGVQTGTGDRWGDYASMSVDPSDDCTFWFTSEYMPTTGPAPWQTRIASFRLPGCGSPASSAPSAPQALTATAGNGQVALSWSAPSSNGGSAVTSYSVYRGTSSGGESTTPIATVTTGTTYTDTGLTNGTTYYYTVAATNSSGTGSTSNEASATPTAPVGATVPGAPSLSAATANGKGVQLTWTTPSSGGSPITGYNVYRLTGSTYGLLASLGVVNSYKDTATKRGVTYTYEVTALNAIGESGPSSPQSTQAR
ncbi:MAG TPA: fibronectin type III domain-containing protein [Candidatus Limnocylindrales bacterium]